MDKDLDAAVMENAAELDKVLTEAAGVTFADLDLYQPVDNLLFDVADQMARARVKLRCAAAELVRSLTSVAAGDDVVFVSTLNNNTDARHHDEAVVTIQALRRPLSLAATMRKQTPRDQASTPDPETRT